MDKFKAFIRMLLFPHPIIIILFSLLGFIAMPISAFMLGDSHPVTIVGYAVSAYALTVICMRIPAIIGFFRDIGDRIPLADRLLHDGAFRMRLTLTVSMVISIAYTVFQIWLGVWHSSAWYYSLGAYYLLLTAMRGFVVGGIDSMGADEKRREEILRYRAVGLMLTASSLALLGISIFIVQFNRGMKHHAITTIALATFSFFAMTMAIIALVRSRGNKSPLLAAINAIKLVSAAVSMLTLETAMLYAFGDPSEEEFRRTITLVTGAVICTLTISLGIYMIVRGNILLKKDKEINGQ